jgi:hypothetical protein
MKIYGIPGSRAACCLWLARQLGIPHENVPVHFKARRKSPELVKANPNAGNLCITNPHTWANYRTSMCLPKGSFYSWSSRRERRHVGPLGPRTSRRPELSLGARREPPLCSPSVPDQEASR